MMKKFAFVPVLGAVLLAGCGEPTTMSAEDGLRPPTFKEAAGALKQSLSYDFDEVKNVKAYKVDVSTKINGHPEYYVCGTADRRAGFTTYNHETNELISGPDAMITDKFFATVYYNIPGEYYYSGPARFVRKGSSFAGVPTLELCGPE